jgi:hypothetical protein
MGSGMRWARAKVKAMRWGRWGRELGEWFEGR